MYTNYILLSINYCVFHYGYPHKLTSIVIKQKLPHFFPSLMYVQFHPALFVSQLSNEVYLPFFQWTLRFSAPPNPPTYPGKNMFPPPIHFCVSTLTCFLWFIVVMWVSHEIRKFITQVINELTFSYFSFTLLSVASHLVSHFVIPPFSVV
jgi:hypothetical protein